MDENPGREGTYWMRDTSGKQIKIPYSKVSRATKAGYQLADKAGYTRDVSHDPNMPKGVIVVGLNAHNQPIYAPVEGPESGAWGRFGSSAVDVVKGVPKGIYHAFKDAPRTAKEAEFMDPALGHGRADLALKRLLVDPQLAEAHKAWEEAQQASLHPTDERLNHQALALGHAIASVVPGIGPMWANIAERAGQQAGMGDVAGAAGTVAAGAGLEAFPKVGGNIMRSEFITRHMPKGSINRMIKTGAGDVKFGKDPAEGILSQGITGNSLGEIGEKVSSRLKAVGQQIDALAQNPAYAGMTVDTTTALKPLDDAIAEAAKNGPDALYQRLKEVRHDITSEWAERRNPQALGGTERYRVGPKKLTMSPYDALKFKRLVGDRVKWDATLPFQDDVNKAMGKVYGLVDAKLDTTLGKRFGDLNQTYSNLVGAAKAIQRRTPVAERNAHWSLSDIALAGTGHVPIAIARKIAMYPGVRTRWTRAAYNLPKTFPELTGAKGALPYVGVSALASQPQQVGEEYSRQYPQFRTKPAEPASTNNPYAALLDGSDGGGDASDTGDQDLVSRAATAYGLNPDLIRAVIGQESGGEAGAVSVKGATGLMQLMPETANKYGVVDATDPEQNVMGGAHYLRDLLDKHDGDVTEALKDYYGRGTPPPGYPTTDQYAQAVSNRFMSSTASPAAPAPAPLAEVKAEAATKKPSAAIAAPATTASTAPNPPDKKYLHTATGPNNHKIGSDDGVTWFDIQTGKRVA
jgi:hypothetical protein